MACRLRFCVVVLCCAWVMSTHRETVKCAGDKAANQAGCCLIPSIKRCDPYPLLLPRPCLHRWQVRSGEPVENADLLRFAQLFNDELTLDNLERVQLVSMCQVRWA